MLQGYHGRGSRAGKWGCFATALVGAPLFMFLLIGDALGDCEPDTSCKHGFVSQVLLPTLVVAAVVGFAVWAAVNAARKNDG